MCMRAHQYRYRSQMEYYQYQYQYLLPHIIVLFSHLIVSPIFPWFVYFDYKTSIIKRRLLHTKCIKKIMRQIIAFGSICYRLWFRTSVICASWMQVENWKKTPKRFGVRFSTHTHTWIIVDIIWCTLYDYKELQLWNDFAYEFEFILDTKEMIRERYRFDCQSPVTLSLCI